MQSMSARSNKAEPSASYSATVQLATPNATRAYSDAHRARFTADFYRETRTGLTVSSIALGTYLGESDDATDALYAATIRAALTGGINIVDAAINYRCQRSERVVGRVVEELVRDGTLRRESIVLCTKAGYVPLDGSPPASRDAYQAYLKKEYFDTGVLKPEDLVAGGHALSPSFIADQLRRSLTNLRVSSIDYFYLHNPEQQVGAISAADFAGRIRAAFELLEEKASTGTIRAYGCATWNGLRLPAASLGHLSLYDLAAIATEVGGKDHHFRIAQLPVNLTMSEAVRVSTQRDTKGRLMQVVEAAAELGIDLVASAPLLQGQLTANLPSQVREMFGGATDAQSALAFPRGAAGILAAAVGMRSTDHLAENLAGVRAG